MFQLLKQCLRNKIEMHSPIPMLKRKPIVLMTISTKLYPIIHVENTSKQLEDLN